MGWRGSCSQIAEFVGDNIIMANCCDNRNTATATCPSVYQNHGAVCAAGRFDIQNEGGYNGPVQTANIVDSTDNPDLYQECIDVCRTRAANAYAGNNNGCE